MSIIPDLEAVSSTEATAEQTIEIGISGIVRCDDCDKPLEAGETAVLRPGGEPPAIICCEACGARRREGRDAVRD